MLHLTEGITLILFPVSSSIEECRKTGKPAPIMVDSYPARIMRGNLHCESVLPPATSQFAGIVRIDDRALDSSSAGSDAMDERSSSKCPTSSERVTEISHRRSVEEKQRNRRKITEGTEWDLERETEFPSQLTVEAVVNQFRQVAGKRRKRGEIEMSFPFFSVVFPAKGRSIKRFPMGLR